MPAISSSAEYSSLLPPAFLGSLQEKVEKAAVLVVNGVWQFTRRATGHGRRHPQKFSATTINIAIKRMRHTRMTEFAEARCG